MAIAFDAASNGTAVATSLTVAHTCTGSNLLLYAYVHSNLSTDFAITATYNSVSMTAVTSGFLNSASNGRQTNFYLINPATGANNIVFTPNASANMTSVNTSYTGAKQSSQPDASGTVSSSISAGGTQTLSITVVAANSWIVASAHGAGDLPNASTGFTSRGTNGNSRGGDSNGPLSAGSNSSSVTNSGAGAESVSMIGISIAPVPVGPANVKTVNGLAVASVKTVNGLAIASVKSINGLE